MAEEDCECRTIVKIFDDDEGFTYTSYITFCPKHAAVDDLIAVLEAIKSQKCYCGTFDKEEGDPDCPHEIAQDAIRKSQIPAGG